MNLIFVLTRIALGGLMLVSGLNKFFHFMPMPDFTGDAATFLGLLAEHQYLDVVGALEVIGGAMLVTGFFVPLGLILLGPVVVNILLFHGLIEGNLAEPMSLAAGVLFLATLFGYLRAFHPIFRPTMERHG